ncbi:replication factor A protein 3 [Agrocybe pediades]|nr:replication factor A protein 3 [Agrocybe pediades]
MYDDSPSETVASTRVNSRRLADYVGQMVRLPCKVLKFEAEGVIVEAADGGQVTATKIPNELSQYVEIVGKVENASKIKTRGCINMGDDLDMKLVNDTIELIHDARFYQKMFR